VDIEMPDLVGKNAAVADDELQKAGFTNVDFGSQDKDDKIVIVRANWTVTKQSAKAGDKLKSDAKIVLTCTKQ
jgi:beta-lactam-binding protein with PASTA domain